MTARAPAVVVDNVSKRFRLQHERPASLKEKVTKLRFDRKNDFWALRDVSLAVPSGSMFALVGHNGSGKSTLLRVIAGIYKPTAGRVATVGRISALLELGAGFHPDLTGRENVYLNAAILGMTRKETDRLYGSIVEFSGLEDFVDTPVRHYSSGMYVRLGFAVAVHVDPHILMVDEVIAVGDAEFQRRCYEHFYKLRQKGTTIVIVTHGLGDVKSMCDEAAWLDHGSLRAVGAAPEIVTMYLDEVNRAEADRHERAGEVAEAHDTTAADTIAIDAVQVLGADGQPVQLISPHDADGAARRLHDEAARSKEAGCGSRSRPSRASSWRLRTKTRPVSCRQPSARVRCASPCRPSRSGRATTWSRSTSAMPTGSWRSTRPTGPRGFACAPGPSR